MNVNIEIICIGNELLIGKIPNTNAYWLAKQVTQLGANVKRVTVVQDIVEEMASCIREAIARKPQFIITTGGLGPTFDDKTLQGIAKAIDRKLEVNPTALAMVKKRTIEYAKKRQMTTEIELTPPRVKMATLPEKTKPLTNPIGSAPGVRVDLATTTIFILPGVPSEMEAIFTEAIAPELKEAVGGNMFCERSIFVQNIMESRLAPLIDQVMSDNEAVYIKSHPVLSEIKSHTEVHLTMTALPEQEPEKKLLRAATQLCRLIEQNSGRAQVQP